MAMTGTRVAGARAAGVPSRRRAALAFTMTSVDAATDIVAPWSALADATVEGNVFFHPGFALPAMRHFGGGAVGVATVAAGSRLVTAAPIVRKRLGGVAPAVSVWTHPYGPLGLPLVDAESVDEAVPALIEGLAPANAGISLTIPDVPLDSSIAVAVMKHAEATDRPIAVLTPHHRAVLKRPAVPVDLRAAQPPRRRKEYTRQMRRLGDLGRVVLETATERDRVCARFEEFVALEAAGWKGRAGSALASLLPAAEFAREAVFNLSAAGAVRIDSMRLDDHPIAILVSFTTGATAFTWKIAYDEAYARFSPGAQLMMDVASSLFADPTVARIDSCATADHPMVDHLWPDRMAIGTVVLGPPHGGILHRLGLTAARAEIAARDRAKRLRDRMR